MSARNLPGTMSPAFLLHISLHALCKYIHNRQEHKCLKCRKRGGFLCYAPSLLRMAQLDRSPGEANKAVLSGALGNSVSLRCAFGTGIRSPFEPIALHHDGRYFALMGNDFHVVPTSFQPFDGVR